LEPSSEARSMLFVPPSAQYIKLSVVQKEAM